MNLINRWAMSGAVGTVLIALPIASFYLVKHWLKRERKRKERQHLKDKMRYLHDILPSRNDRQCTCCGGQATSLDLNEVSGLWVCRDRELCRQTMIHAALLKDVESA